MIRLYYILKFIYNLDFSPNMHKLHLYNTLGRRLEQFIPIDDSLVRIYSCGPTVYSTPHIGNIRSFVFASLLKNVLGGVM